MPVQAPRVVEEDEDVALGLDLLQPAVPFGVHHLDDLDHCEVDPLEDPGDRVRLFFFDHRERGAQEDREDDDLEQELV